MPGPKNTQFSLAVHLLTLLSKAAPGSVMDSGKLAVSPATHPAFVRRLLSRLKEAGLVRSQLGAHGGWLLAREPERINLAEVWDAVNDNGSLLGVHDPDPTCTVGWRVEANLRALDRRAQELLLQELKTRTIADLKADVLAHANTHSDR